MNKQTWQEFANGAIKVLKHYHGKPELWAQAWEGIESTAKSRFGLKERAPELISLWNLDTFITDMENIK